MVTDSTGVIFERGATANNIGLSGPIALTHPNLIVTNVATAATAISGGALTVNWTVQNSGTGATAASSTVTDKVYLATGTTVDGSAVLLTTVTHTGTLAANGTYAGTANITLPNGITGNYHIVVVTNSDGAIVEGPQASGGTGASGAIAITLAPYADLTVTNVTAPPLLVGDPVSLAVSWTVTNAGTGMGSATTWVDRVILSPNSAPGGPGDIVVGNFVHTGLLTVNGSYTQSQTILLPPALQGHYNLFVVTNATNTVYEGPNTATDIASPSHFVDVVTQPYADLVVNTVNAPATGQNGQPLTVSWSVTNDATHAIGPTNVPQWTDTIYMSSDPTGATGLVQIGTLTHEGSLGVGQSYQASTQVTLPKTASGTEYIFVQSSGPFVFIYTQGNIARSNAVNVTFVPPPPVTLDVTSVIGPSSALDGATIPVSWTVNNDGPNSLDSTNSWTDSVYIAPNGNFSQAINVGNFVRTGGLAAGINYTRTENIVLPSHIQGFYEIFVQTDSGSVIAQTTRTHDLGSSNPLTIALTPRPDLQVTSGAAPVEVTARGIVDVKWTVTNEGTVATPQGNSHWNDGVYLSLTPTLQTGAMLMQDVPNVSALDPGESYNNETTFQLPKGYAGNVYIIIRANDSQSFDEFPNGNNNTFAIPMAIDTTPVEPPDLVTSNVFTPGTAFDGSTITVHYQVSNLGAGVTFPDSWADTVWLTLGKDRPNPARGDIQLGTFGHTGALNVGQSYTNDVQVTLPAHISGQYYITVWSNNSQSVYTQEFDVNLNPDAPNDIHGDQFKAIPLTVLLRPPADLQVTSISAPPTAVGGKQVTLTWTVANKGAAITDQSNWADAIYLSNDGVTKGQLVFALPHQGQLDIGQSYTQTATFTLPPSASGSYFIIETNDAPTIAETDDDLFNQQIQQIVDATANALAGNDPSSLTADQILQILAGPAPQATVYEGPYADNDTRAVASTVTNTPADLVVNNVTVPATQFSGEPINVSWTVTNQGADVYPGTTQWIDYVYISSDPTFIPNRATLAAAVVHSNANDLLSGQSYTGTTSITLPEGISGQRYIYVFSDRNAQNTSDPNDNVSISAFPDWPDYFSKRVWELDKSNNGGSASVNVVYREADLQISNLIVGSPIDSGQEVPITYTVTNVGTRATRVPVWFDGIYISQDQTLDGYDEQIGQQMHKGVLNPGQSYTVTTTAKLPDNISGSFYILVNTDSPYGVSPGFSLLFPYPATQGNARIVQEGDPQGMVHEFADEDNNLAVAPLTVNPVPLPNLQVTTVTGPQQVMVGQGFTVNYTVQNTGLGDVPADEGIWTDSVYLSADQYLDVNSDIHLGDVQHIGGLAAGASYNVSKSYSLPFGITGPYYIFVLTDRPTVLPQGQVFETDEADNATASAIPMLIELPPPSDLQVDTVSLPPNAVAGGTVTLTYTVSNHGDAPATGHWSDAAFLSQSGILDSSAQLIGTTSFGTTGGDFTLNPGDSYTGTITAVLPVELPASYRVIVRTNVFDDIYEGPFYNNDTTIAPDAIDVTVNPLVVNVPTATTLSSGQSQLFAINVPAGKTLQVALTSDSGGGANEIYVKYQGLPSSLNYDATFSGYLVANQTAVIPTTQGGTYYVLIRGQSDATNSPMHLLATFLPFGISNVTPDAGGDSAFVTTTITGAGFQPGAIVKLVRPGIAEYEPVNYSVIDGTKIVATFDFTNAIHGLYDVEVINPDGTTAILPYRYQIQTAQPIDLTVGMGGPTHLDIGATGVYGVTIKSTTNVDTPYVHIEYGVPNVANPAPGLIPGPALVFNSDLTGTPNVPGVSFTNLNSVVDLNGNEESIGFSMDFQAETAGNLTFTVETYPGLAQAIAQDPNFLADLSDDELAQLSFKFFIQAAATPMTAAEFVAYQSNVALTLRTNILSDPNAPQALVLAAGDATTWTSAYLAALTDEGVLRPQDQPPGIRTTAQFTSLMGEISGGILVEPAGSSIATGDSDSLVTFFNDVRQWYGSNDAATGGGALADESLYNLNLSHPTHQETFTIQVGTDFNVGTVAPGADNLGNIFGITGANSNDVSISSPAGYGPFSLVPANTPLPYTIKFTNPNSTELVSTLQVVQQLSSELDPRTFQLGAITLGGITIQPPANRAAFAASYDFSGSLGFELEVSAGVDVNNDIATWTFTAIDPTTGVPIQAPLAGLLSNGGSGSVSYSIQLQDTAQTGDTISAAARVIFNNDTPLDTFTTSVTADAVPPASTLNVTDLSNDRYALSWSANDDVGGSGVAEYNVYASTDGGPWVAFLQHTTLTSASHTGAPTDTTQFVVISVDNAGNIEAAPPGVELPPFYPNVNLGGLPTVTTTPQVSLPVATPPSATPANPLFIQAQAGIPEIQAGGSDFATVLAPFETGAFATGIGTSNDNVGALGIAFSPDGNKIYVSGGANRNQLFVFSRSGGPATPLATLSQPIYDMVFDASGQLWATTGGGSLVQLDPNTGQVVGSYGDEMELGLAAKGNLLYVSTTSGIETFNTTTHVFAAFSSTRVQGLAVAPDGSLWGVTFPTRGQVVTFDKNGKPTIEVNVADADGLAFGKPGTPLAGLLFVNRNSGIVTAVDLASLQTVDIATGGTRGEYTAVGPDGRVYISQSNQVDVVFPLVAPNVITTNPINNSSVNPAVTNATITFDSAMDATSTTDPHSVINTANYTLTDLTRNQVVNIGAAIYDNTTHTAQIFFESLSPNDQFQLTVNSAIESSLGLTLAAPYSSTFSVLQSIATLTPNFANTRLSRSAGTVSFDVSVTDNQNAALAGPIQIVFTSLTAADMPNATGVTNDGHPYITVLASGTLNVGDATAPVTITIADADGHPLDLTTSISAALAPDVPPTFTSTPPTTAAVGTPLTYTPTIDNPSNGAVSYLLLNGPEGAAVDPATGVLTFTPTVASAPSSKIDLRVFDSRGGFADQMFTLAVTGTDPGPILVPIGTQTIAEGSTLTIPVGIISGAANAAISVDHLPPGAHYDAASNSIILTPAFGTTGEYDGVTVYASDGTVTNSESFTINVTPAPEAPTILLDNATIRAGETYTQKINGTDLNGQTLTYSSDNLPLGATISPTTGVFTWMPTYTEPGVYSIDITASDSLSTTTRTLNITVLNVQGPVTFDTLGTFDLLEGKPFAVDVHANNPNFPTAPADTTTNGTSDAAGTNAGNSHLTLTHTALPAGATFDSATDTLSWTPGFNQGGTYTFSFTATSDGAGTGVITSATTTVTLNVLPNNAPPAVEAISDQSVNVGSTLDIPITASDPHGEPLVLTATGLPAFATFTDNGNGTGVIHVAPGVNNGGNSVVTITATNNGNGIPAKDLSGSTQFVLTAFTLDTPPVLGYVGSKVALIGQPLTFTVTASDKDQDPLTFAATNLPSGATFTGTNIYGQATFSWTPTAADIGTHAVTLTVTDSGNGGATSPESDAQTINIVVRSTNQSPVLQPLAAQTGAEGSPLGFAVSATDPDGDPLTYSVTNLPSGATFNAQTGAFAWTPVPGQAGTYTVTFRAGDGAATALMPVSIIIAHTAQTPVLVPINNQNTSEGVPLQFTISAGDLDNVPLSYSAVGSLPAGATFNATTQTFSWTPSTGQAGDYTLTFQVASTEGLSATTTAQIHVAQTLLEPQINHISGHTIVVGQAFTTTIPAVSLNAGHTLTFVSDNLPIGATLNAATGVITWTPTAPQIGTYAIDIAAVDGELASFSTLNLQVAAVPVAPALLITLTPGFPVSVGQSVLIHPTASSIADIASLTLTVNGTPVTLDSLGRYAYVPTSTAPVTIDATATDIDGHTSSTTTIMKVRDLSDTTAPVLSMTPGSGATISAATPIVATVSDTNLNNYTLTLTDARGSVTTLATGQNTVTNAMLATLDPAALENGVYTLTLTASDVSGNTSSVSSVLDINVASKSDALTTSTTDATFTLDGVNIPVTRIYSSLDRSIGGAFGLGWHLAGIDAAITLSTPAAGQESLSTYTPVRDGTRLYLTLPSGARVGFTFTPVAHSQTGVNYFTPAWVADAGVPATLTTSSALLTNVNGLYYQLGTGLPYNPENAAFGAAAFTLSFGGQTYTFDATGALRSITGGNAVNITVTSNSMVAPDGSRLDFIRDSAGRITEIDSSTGTRLRYAYDAAGDLVTATNESTQTRATYGYASAGLLTTQIPATGIADAYTYAPGGDLLTTTPLAGNIGLPGQFAGITTTGTLAVGESTTYALTISPQDLAGQASGLLTLGFDITGNGGLNPATVSIGGITPAYARTDVGHSIALYSFSTPGIYTFTLEGLGNTAGGFSLNTFVAGEVLGQNQVTGADETALLAALGSTTGSPGYLPAADINRDGVIDTTDQTFLESNLGFVALQPPTASASTSPITAYPGVTTTIDLGSLVSDPNGLPVAIAISGVTGGTVRPGGTSHTFLFTPTPGFTGSASITFVADDGYLFSAPAIATVTVPSVTLVGLSLTQVASTLNPGDSTALVLNGIFSDGTTLPLPTSSVTFASTNPSVVQVGSNGAVAALADGTVVVTATYNGLEAGTAVTVGPLPTVGTLQFFPTSYTLQPGGQTRQFIVNELQPDGTVIDRSAASNGTIYILSNASLGTITPDGLFTSGNTVGSGFITVIYQGRTQVVPIQIANAVLGPVAVTTTGGATQDSSGDVLDIPAGALTGPATVSITNIAPSQLGLGAPDGFTFDDAFTLNVGGTPLSTPASISIVAPAGSQVGDVLYLFRKAKLLVSDNTYIDAWEVVDDLVVHADGRAYTSSPPDSGASADGQFVLGIRAAAWALLDHHQPELAQQQHSGRSPDRRGLLRGQQRPLSNQDSGSPQGKYHALRPPRQSSGPRHHDDGKCRAEPGPGQSGRPPGPDAQCPAAARHQPERHVAHLRFRTDPQRSICPRAHDHRHEPRFHRRRADQPRILRRAERAGRIADRRRIPVAARHHTHAIQRHAHPDQGHHSADDRTDLQFLPDHAYRAAIADASGPGSRRGAHAGDQPDRRGRAQTAVVRGGGQLRGRRDWQWFVGRHQHHQRHARRDRTDPRRPGRHQRRGQPRRPVRLRRQYRRGHDLDHRSRDAAGSESRSHRQHHAAH